MSLADKKNNEVQTILSTSSKILLILEALETTNFVFVTCVDTYLLGLWDGKLDTLGWFLSFFFFCDAEFFHCIQDGGVVIGLTSIVIGTYKEMTHFFSKIPFSKGNTVVYVLFSPKTEVYMLLLLVSLLFLCTLRTYLMMGLD